MTAAAGVAVAVPAGACFAMCMTLFVLMCMSVLMLIYSIVRWATGDTIIGWASVICSVWAIGGLILLSLGVIGEYIGKIYMETKARPRYIISDRTWDKTENGAAGEGGEA